MYIFLPVGGVFFTIQVELKQKQDEKDIFTFMARSSRAFQWCKPISSRKMVFIIDIVKGKAVVVRNWSTSYTGDVVIPETVEYSGQVYVVDSIGSNAFDNCDELTTVRLPEGLKAIGENAFIVVPV